MPPGVPGLRVAAPPVTERSSPMPGEAGVPAAGVRAQTRGTRPLCPSLAPFLIVSSSASPDARTLGSPGSTGETVSGSTPVRGCGAGRRGRERDLPRGLRSVLRGGSPVPSPVVCFSNSTCSLWLSCQTEQGLKYILKQLSKGSKTR